MKRIHLWLSVVLCAAPLVAQSTPQQVSTILDQKLNQAEVVSFQLKQYLMAQVPPLPKPQSAKAWTAQASEIRNSLLQNVVFHGWPKAWVDSPPRFEDMGAVPSGKGYTRHKLRFEVVPGFWADAILYEPANLRGTVPAILNVTGHVGPEGKSISYEQKRCINFALQGMIALSVDWLGQGELSAEQDQHWYSGHLDLVGANGVGLFYLEMRRGLDYLSSLSNVDQNRIGMTGLSGGGWQTMFLSDLDTRIQVSVPVAGYDALAEWIPRMPYAAGDNEQAATDVFKGQDYEILTAMRAPRPTLLIYNAEDDCCFRAEIVKPYVYEDVKPFFKLYGKAENLQFHENTDPSTHNYEADNRMAAYRFFARHFSMPIPDHEVPVGEQIASYRELEVPLPKDNLTILSLARKLASEIKRAPIPADAAAKAKWASAKRTSLREVVRYAPVKVSQTWALSTTKSKGVVSLGYRFELNNNLPATGIWIEGIGNPSNAPVTIVLNDKGKKFAANDVEARVNRGKQVLALDLLFTGDDSTQGIPRVWAYPEMLAAAGQRPLGMEAAQLLALTHWMAKRTGVQHVRLEVRGMRMQIVALVASALEPNLFSEITVHDGIPSLGYLLSKPVHYEDAADLFCLDLYKDFDLNELAELAGSSVVSYEADEP